MVLGVDPSNDADFTITQNIENPNPENLSSKGTEFAKKILNPSNPDKITDETAENWNDPAGSGSELEDSDGDGYADNFLGVAQDKAEEITGSYGQDPDNYEQDTSDKVDEAVNKLRESVKDGALSGASSGIFNLPGDGLAQNTLENETGLNDENESGFPNIGVTGIPGVNPTGGNGDGSGGFDLGLPDQINLNPFEGLENTLIKGLTIGVAGAIIITLIQEVTK